MTNRIGVIADIHGNAFGLRQVLTELDAARVEAIICLGDVAVLGPDPAGVIRELRSREIATVLGNTDVWLLDPPPVPVSPPDEGMSADLTAWIRSRLDADDVAWLADLPITLALTVGKLRLFAFHATPTSLDGDVQDEIPELADRAIGPEVVLCAHTHNQSVRPLGAGWLVNPGSAGLPGVGPGFDHLVRHESATWLEYAIVDGTGAGNVAISLHRTAVDVAQMFAWAEATGMPGIDWWKARWGMDDRVGSEV